MIFTASLSVAIFGLLATFYQSWSRKSLVNPHLIYWIVTFYTIYFPALLGNEYLRSDNLYNFIFLFGNLGALLALILLPIRPSVVFSENTSQRFHPLILVMALVYFFYLVTSVYNLVISYGGFYEALIYSRLDAYLEEGIKKGAGLGLLMLLPEVCYYLYIAYCLNNNKVKRSACLTILLVIFYIFTANTRLPIIFPIATFSILYLYKFHVHSIRKIFPVAISLGIIAVMIFSVVGSYLRNGQLENLNLSPPQIISELSNRQDNQLGYYDWINDLYVSLEEEKFSHEYGLGLFYYPVISFIPRAIWETKPNTSSSNRLTEFVYDRKIGDGQPIHTFHLVGDGYYQFSWFGAFLYPYLFIYLVTLMQRFVARNITNGEYWQIYIMVSSVPFVRAEVPIVKFFLTLLIVFIIYQIHRVKYRDAK